MDQDAATESALTWRVAEHSCHFASHHSTKVL
jgi:hypothetical protein